MSTLIKRKRSTDVSLEDRVLYLEKYIDDLNAIYPLNAIVKHQRYLSRWDTLLSLHPVDKQLELCLYHIGGVPKELSKIVLSYIKTKLDYAGELQIVY